MRKLFTLLAAVAMTAVIWAQSSNLMSYQAVIRNASGALVKSSNVGIKISILQGSATGTVAYAETQVVETNANGLLTLEIGGGIVVSGSYAKIDWSKGSYFVETETDPTGGSS